MELRVDGWYWLFGDMWIGPYEFQTQAAIAKLETENLAFLLKQAA